MSHRILSITPERLKGLFAGDGAVELYDVRDPGEYRAGHITGARSLPLDGAFPADLVARAGEGDTTVVLTCHSGVRAFTAAQRLVDAGAPRVTVLEGGTAAWAGAGLPLRRCGSAISLQRQVQITVGLLVILKVLFGFTVHELFFAGAAFLGAGLLVAGVTRWCGLERLLALMPWNRGGRCADQAPA
jgi:rhodanese-related sulfurtransferase